MLTDDVVLSVVRLRVGELIFVKPSMTSLKVDVPDVRKQAFRTCARSRVCTAH